MIRFGDAEAAYLILPKSIWSLERAGSLYLSLPLFFVPLTPELREVYVLSIFNAQKVSAARGAFSSELEMNGGW